MNMKRLFGIIREWASIVFFAVIVALLLCAFIVCATELSAKSLVFISSCGLVGCVLALLIFIYGSVCEIKDRRAK